MMELVNGRVDGVITDRIVGITAMKELSGGENIQSVGELLRLESMGIAMNKDDSELLEQIDEILEEMHTDGTLTQISQKWLDGEDVSIK